MIPYEELVQALDRYVAKNGGTPMSARAPSSSAAPAYEAPAVEAPGHDVVMGGYDEPRDPDMGGEDATHVGSSTGSMPPPLQPVNDEGSNEIDIGDVLADDELS